MGSTVTIELERLIEFLTAVQATSDISDMLEHYESSKYLDPIVQSFLDECFEHEHDTGGVTVGVHGRVYEGLARDRA
jgi:hypothetical protein